MTPGPVIPIRTVCKHGLLRLNHEYHIYLRPAFPFQDCHRFASSKLCFSLETFLVFLHQIDQAHLKEEQLSQRNKIALLDGHFCPATIKV